MIRLFVFDYGRTLFDRESNRFFDNTHPVLNKLSTRFKLAIVSYSTPEEVRRRIHALRNYGIYDLFDEIIFCDTPEGKDNAYQQLLGRFKITANEMAIVDDHVIRGIAWGNKNGSTTYWFKHGKFSNRLPDKDTGIPTYTITDLTSILDTI